MRLGLAACWVPPKSVLCCLRVLVQCTPISQHANLSVNDIVTFDTVQVTLYEWLFLEQNTNHCIIAVLNILCSLPHLSLPFFLQPHLVQSHDSWGP